MILRPSALSTAVIALTVFAFAGCPKRIDETKPKSGPPRPYQLLTDTPERETSQLEERREDVEVDTRDFERTPHVIATGETPVMRLDGARAELFGDAAATQGWSVDNFVLLEVLDEQGNVLHRASTGFAQTVMIGSEHVDNVGPMSFTFRAGEVDITSMLPESKPFKLRATALDIGGVGRVSDLYVVLRYPVRDTGDDLRNQ